MDEQEKYYKRENEKAEKEIKDKAETKTLADAFLSCGCLVPLGIFALMFIVAIIGMIIGALK